MNTASRTARNKSPLRVRLLGAAALTAIVAGLLSISFTASALDPGELDAKSAVLMEAETGKVLYELNPDESLPPASVTKVMTLLLVMEAIDDGSIAMTDNVSISDNAAGMGGSQVFLSPGEQMTVETLIKCTVIASANDAAVALAEYVGGSEEGFVSKMNERAAQLGMNSTHFENATGLDDTAVNHVTSARDIAIMSSQLMRHEKILEYSSTWMDSIRDGAFTLTNTNRLVRFYDGATGLKTGSTSKAGFCISATAKRGNVHLIAVIMGASSRDSRNVSAKKLLDTGFANVGLFRQESRMLEPLPVHGAIGATVSPVQQPFAAVTEKSLEGKVETAYELPEYLDAPVEAGQLIGKAVYSAGGEVLGESDITASDSVAAATFFDVFMQIVLKFFMN